MTEATNRLELFNLDDVFGTMEEETKLNSILMYPKKGDDLLLAMLPPMEFEGKAKLSVAVNGEYQGKPTTQHIVRFIVLHKEGKSVDWSKSKYVGIPLSPTYVTQIIKAYKTEFPIAVQTCSLVILNKAEKMVLTFTPKTVTIPDEVWQGGESLTWQELIQAHTDMKNNMANKNGKKEATEDTPWS